MGDRMLFAVLSLPCGALLKIKNSLAVRHGKISCGKIKPVFYFTENHPSCVIKRWQHHVAWMLFWKRDQCILKQMISWGKNKYLEIPMHHLKISGRKILGTGKSFKWKMTLVETYAPISFWLSLHLEIIMAIINDL